MIRQTTIPALLLLAALRAMGQEIISVQPDTAEPGEYLGVSITGKAARFYNSSFIYGQPYIDAPAKIYAYSYQVVDTNHIDAVFRLPVLADTGTFPVNINGRADLKPGTFTIAPISSKTSLRGYAPASAYGEQGLAVRIAFRNPLATRPAPGLWKAHLERGARKILPVDCAWPAADTLECGFNFGKPDSSRAWDFVIGYDQAEVWRFKSGFQIWSYVEKSMDPIPAQTVEPGATVSFRTRLRGRVLVSPWSPAPLHADLYQGKDTIRAISINLSLQDSVLAVRFLIPDTAKEGLWHFRYTSGPVSQFGGGDTLYWFGTVKVDKAARTPGIAALQPDSMDLASQKEVVVRLRNVALSAAPDPGDFWLARNGGLVRAKSAALDAEGFKAVIALGLKDSVGLWHAYFRNGTDTLALYNAFRVAPPRAAIVSIEPAWLLAGGSARVKITGTKTRFTEREDAWHENSYPGVHLVKDGWHNAVSVSVENDSVLFADFQVPSHWTPGKLDLIVSQRAPSPQLKEPAAMDIRVTATERLLLGLKPDSAIQSEKWIVVATGLRTGFLADKASLNVILAQGKYRLAVSGVKVESDLSVSFQVETPLDAPAGHYDLIVIPAPGDTLIRYSAYSVKYKRELLDYGPKYILTTTRDFRVSVKTRNMQMDKYKEVWMILRDFTTQVSGQSVKVFGSDSAEADFRFDANHYGTFWGLDVMVPNKHTVRKERAIQRVNEIPAGTREAKDRPGAWLVSANRGWRVSLVLAAPAEALLEIFDARGRLAEYRPLGHRSAGKHALMLPAGSSGAHGLLHWRISADGRVLSKGIVAPHR